MGASIYVSDDARRQFAGDLAVVGRSVGTTSSSSGSFPPADPWSEALSRPADAAPVEPDQPVSGPPQEEHDLDHLWDCIMGSSRG